MFLKIEEKTFSDSSCVAETADSTCDLSQISIWDNKRRLVIDSNLIIIAHNNLIANLFLNIFIGNLKSCRAPIDKVNSLHRFDLSYGKINVLQRETRNKFFDVRDREYTGFKDTEYTNLRRHISSVK